MQEFRSWRRPPSVTHGDLGVCSTQGVGPGVDCRCRKTTGGKEHRRQTPSRQARGGPRMSGRPADLGEGYPYVGPSNTRGAGAKKRDLTLRIADWASPPQTEFGGMAVAVPMGPLGGPRHQSGPTSCPLGV